MNISRTQIAAIVFAALLVTSLVAFAELRSGPSSEANESPIETTAAESPTDPDPDPDGDDEGSADETDSSSDAEDPDSVDETDGPPDEDREEVPVSGLGPGGVSSGVAKRPRRLRVRRVRPRGVTLGSRRSVP